MMMILITLIVIILCFLHPKAPQTGSEPRGQKNYDDDDADDLKHKQFFLGMASLLYSSKTNSKFLNLSTGLPRRQSPQKIAVKWRYKHPIKNLTAHYNSNFCVSFHFCAGSLKMLLIMSELGLNIIRFISNLYGVVFS